MAYRFFEIDQGVALPLSLSGTCGTLPVHKLVGSGWTAEPLSTPPGDVSRNGLQFSDNLFSRKTNQQAESWESRFKECWSQPEPTTDISYKLLQTIQLCLWLEKVTTSVKGLRVRQPSGQTVLSCVSHRCFCAYFSNVFHHKCFCCLLIFWGDSRASFTLKINS